MNASKLFFALALLATMASGIATAAIIKGNVVRPGGTACYPACCPIPFTGLKVCVQVCYDYPDMEVAGNH